MEYQTIKARATKLLQDQKAKQKQLEAQQLATQTKLDDLLKQQNMLEQSRVAIDQARPLLSAESIKQLEALANTALSTIFDIQAEVSYDVESKRFVLRDGDNVCDLADANGGGIVTVLSEVFSLFLLVKQGCRRIVVHDEQFYAVSEQYFDAFWNFLKKAYTDLGIDALIISHDARLTPDMVDRVYRIENGKSIRLK